MILFVGLANSQLVDIAKDQYKQAILVTEDNVSANISVGYTGIEEFVDKKIFLNLLLSAEEIFYHPETFDQTKFDFYNPTTTSQGLTENFLLLAKQQGVTVHNLTFLGQDTVANNRKIYLELIDIRKHVDGPQIWGVGCSMTYGVGVSVDQRYINLLGKRLNMPTNCLALPGASIAWAADQALRSDIRAGDIVVWGITSKNRLPLVVKNKINHLNAYSIDFIDESNKKYLIRMLSDTANIEYQNLTSIDQVVNFCNKIGARLLLFGLLIDPTDFLYLQHYPNFYQYPNEYVDLGIDNEHPGPKQHELYAEIVCKLLDKNPTILE
jgi:hypothetical protein